MTTTRHERHTAAWVLASLIIALVAAGCSPPTGSPSVERAAVVVAHHDTELPPALSDAERAGFRALASGRDDAVVSVLAAGDPLIEDVDLEPRRANGEIEHGPRRDALIEARLTALDATIERAASRSRSTDVLGALGNAVRLGSTTVHVLSAGLSDTDPFDMRVSGWDADPQRIATDLRAAHAVPDAAGRTLVLSGLGRTAGRQPPLDESAQQSLRAQWTAACAATGARCVIDDGTRPLRAGVRTDVPGPVLPVERASTRATVAGGVELSLPSSVLFVAGSCALRDPAAAASLLAGVADRLRTGTGTASVSGRTAPVGPGDGVELATCRARAVAGLLLGAGAPAAALTRIAGDGSLADPPSASRDNEGRPDLRTYPSLRRVVVVLTPVRP